MQRILVRFKGEGSGVEELSWGQWAQWNAIVVEDGRVQSAGGSMELEPGTTLEHLVHLLSYVMSRHQSLRTRLVFDGERQPSQLILSEGEVELEVYDTEEPAQLASEIETRYDATNWDLEHGWPVRWAVIRKAGAPSHFVAMYAHFVIDAYGIEAMVKDLSNMDPTTGRELAPPDYLQPADQARKQKSAHALKMGEISLRLWEEQLRTVPLVQFGKRAPERERQWEASFRTRAGYLALAVIAERTSVHSSAILLGAYASALTRMTGNAVSAIRILVSNRFRPGLRDAVAPVAQSALCVVDAEGVPFDELVRRAFSAQLNAGKHAYYDPRKLWKLIDSISAERGARPELQCYYNDRRRSMANGVQLDITPSKQDVIAALDESEIRWGEKMDEPGAVAFFLVNPVTDTLDYTLNADTARLSPSEMESLLRAVESVLVEGAFSAT